MIGNLEALLAPWPEALFDEHFAEKKRLHLTASDRGRAVSLLPWDTINRLIESDRQTPSAFKLRREGSLVPAGMYARAGTRERVRASALRSLFAQGASIVIEHVEELVPQLGRLAASLERRLGCTAWINAYLTVGKTGALEPHYDTHDVLIVQIYGRKRWRSFGSSTPVPIVPSPRGAKYEAPIWEDWLQQGEVLYLPRGEAHAATAAEEPSVHLTIGLEPRRGVDLLDWLREKAAEEALFRTDLPREEAALRAHETRLKNRLHALVDDLNVAAFLEADDQRRAPQTLVDLNLTGRLSPDAVVVPTPRRRVPLATDVDAAASVSVGGETHLLSAPARRVLAHLLKHDAVAFRGLVAAFAPLGEREVGDAVRELVTRGLAAVRPQ